MTYQIFSKAMWRPFLAGLAFIMSVAFIPEIAVAADDAQSLPSVINKSGRQRALSQRMGKAYAMQALNVEPQLAKDIGQKSQTLFVSQLGDLKKVTPTPEIAEAVKALDSAWQTYEKSLQQTPSKENAKSVYDSGEVVLQRAIALTALYEKQLGTAQGKLVNLSGRQRMLSQRLGRAFFFNQLGVTTKELETGRQEFAQNMKELIAAPQNTPAIKEELAQADQQWQLFMKAIDSGAAGSKDVATISERLLEQMNSLAEKYEKLSN